MRRAAMRLALLMSRPDVDGLVDELTADGLVEWLAYLELEPAGPLVDDVRSARLMTLLANANRDRKRRRQPYKLKEFMLSAGSGRPSDEALIAKIKAIRAMYEVKRT